MFCSGKTISMNTKSVTLFFCRLYLIKGNSWVHFYPIINETGSERVKWEETYQVHKPSPVLLYIMCKTLQREYTKWESWSSCHHQKVSTEKHNHHQVLKLHSAQFEKKKSERHFTSKEISPNLSCIKIQVLEFSTNCTFQI